MNYTLMQKNYAVMDIEIDPVNGRIIDIGRIHDKKRLPFGIADDLGNADRYRFEDWWKSRSIPLSRQGIEKALRQMNISTPDELIAKCLGLSLSDQYWIKPNDTDILWENINFFDNDFSEEIGNILFGEKPSSDRLKATPHGDCAPDAQSEISSDFPMTTQEYCRISRRNWTNMAEFMQAYDVQSRQAFFVWCRLNMRSPDVSANGWLKKKWKIIDGKRCLIKGGDGFQQQPYNEVIASIIAERLGISHVGYRLGYSVKKLPVCVCENFITKDTEFIAAGSINMVLPFENGESKYEHFCRCCEKLNIPKYKKSLDEMIVLDYIIANQDRHMGNFGAVRNVESMEFVGLSPIFDSGTSLRYDTPDDEIDPMLNVESQPFESFHNEQIKLVTEPERFDLSKLKGIETEIAKVFSDRKYDAYMKPDRPQRIIDVVLKRIEMLEFYFSQDLNQDQTENVDITMN